MSASWLFTAQRSKFCVGVNQRIILFISWKSQNIKENVKACFYQFIQNGHLQFHKASIKISGTINIFVSDRRKSASEANANARLSKKGHSWVIIKVTSCETKPAFWRLCSRRLFENIVTKEGIAQNEQFLLLPQCFPLLVIGYPFNYK